MDFTGIQTFLKVSELRSFSQAAVQLGFSQPTVSIQIARLEQELGYPLFERMGHRITLTEQGRIFLQYAQHVQLLTEQMKDSLSGSYGNGGTLRIAMADSLCTSFIQPYLLTYNQLYPNVSVYIYTGATESLFHQLSHNEVDLVYTLDNRISRSEFITQQENREPVYFCAAASHPLTRRLQEQPDTVFDWPEIKEYPLYLTEAGVSYRQNLERLLGEMSEELTPSVELGNVRLLLHLTEQSNGISFLPDFVIHDSVCAGNLAVLPVKNIDICVWRQLIYHKGKYLTPAIKGMMELLHNAAVDP